ncbi:MAG: MaoC family dehydratase N-terminal domain-containing protein [Proteobacteria bacterium]|nr:MaoC family dehydratase N-terminal domain-containing protein [Pseudomonadota bacterium]
MSTDAANAALDAQALAAWIGRSEIARDHVTPVPCAALAATLDHDPALPPTGTPLPPLWHWLYFLPLARASEIGPDGHPKRGGFLPPVPLPRRMWAGSRFQFAAPLVVGDAITRTSTIEDVAVKEGRSGTLVFVVVRHEVVRERDHHVAIVEHHDIVYRAAAPASATPPPPEPAPATASWQRIVTPDPVLLFRYSALTFNGHRIHYDAPYVTGVEGYPGLIVHGPLMATLLLDLVRRQRPDVAIERFAFRALRPVFATGAFTVCGEPRDERSVRLWIRDTEGALAMDATCVLAA